MIKTDKTALVNSSGRAIFSDFLTENGFTNSTLDVFDKITALYEQINAVINISGLHDVDDIYVKHYLDSAFPYKHFGRDCCDVGCGGGFPTIPIAVLTGLDITGLDGVGKKLGLIERCKSELNINNIHSVHDRAENYAKTHKFDTVCARAVAETDKALSYCAPLANPNGKILLYKTQNDSSAKREICKKLSTELEEIIDYTLPSTDIKRRLFVYRKL